MADDIDDLLRRTMKTLDDQVPSGYFEDLPQRTLGRLEVSLMQTGSDQESASGPSATGVPVPPEEDSGLHDIRSLAQTTKQRISSRKITDTPRGDDDVIANSSSGWKAVALPEPAKMISLPDVADLPARPRKLAEASAVELPDVTPIDARIARRPRAASKRRNRTIAVVGVGFAAAAGLVLFVATRDKGVTGETSNPATTTPPPSLERATATKPQAPGGQADHGVSATSVPQEIATDRIGTAKGATTGEMPPAGAAGSAAPDAAMTTTAPDLDKTREVKDDKDAKDKVPVKSIGKSVTKTAPTPPKKKELGKVPGGKPEVVPSKSEPRSDNEGKKTKDDGKKSKKDKSDEPSFDDLLKEAGETGEKKPAKPSLDKKGLSGDDFKKGMGTIAGRAAACYKGTPGTVAVRVAIGPDGHVQKVTVSGSFAGTPSGECVSAAVKGATFPAWDGPPQSFGYSFLLSE